MILFVLVALGAIGALIGNRTGHAGFGFIAGCLLGPIGWLLTLPMKPSKRRRDELKRLQFALYQAVAQSMTPPQPPAPPLTMAPPPPGPGTIVERYSRALGN